MEIFLICCLVAVVLGALKAKLSALETALLIVVFSVNVIGGRHTTTQITEVSIQQYKIYIPTSSSVYGEVGVPPLSREAQVGLPLSCNSSTCVARSNTSSAISSTLSVFGALVGCACSTSIWGAVAAEDPVALVAGMALVAAVLLSVVGVVPSVVGVGQQFHIHRKSSYADVPAFRRR